MDEIDPAAAFYARELTNSCTRRRDVSKEIIIEELGIVNIFIRLACWNVMSNEEQAKILPGFIF